MRVKLLIALFLIGLCFPKPVSAALVINEFSIEPEQKVELWNSGSETIDISNWIIDDSGGSTYFTIPSGTSLAPENCLVFAHDFNLNKASSDTVRLLDPSFHLLDGRTYDKSPGNYSWYRLPDGADNWTIGENTFGLKNETINSCLPISPTAIIPTDIIPSPIISLAEPTPTPQIIDQIYLSEVMVNPDNGNEWVEIYNNQDQALALNNWSIDDGENEGASPKLFSLSVNNKSWEIIELNSSIFNNAGDIVRLLNPDKKEIDRFEYIDSEKGYTFSRQEDATSGQWCKTEETKKTRNKNCFKSDSAVLASVSPTLSLTTPIPSITLIPSKPVLKITVGTRFYLLPKKKSQVLGVSTELHNSQQSFYYYLALIVLGCNFICHFLIFLYILYFHYGQKNFSKIFSLG